MSVEIEKTGPVRTKITLTVDADAVGREMEKVYKQLRREAAIPGFRPGKAPMSMLKRRYKHYAEQEVKGKLVGDHLAKAVEENEIKLVGAPELEKDEINEDGSLTVVAVMETRPEVELGEYKGLEVTCEKARVLEAAVESHLEGMRQQDATMEEIADRDEVQKGDYVRVDLVGRKDGKVIKGSDMKGQVLELGEQQYIAGLSEGIVGMKKEETKDIQATMPENYPDEKLARQEVTFSVTLQAVLHKDVPELDDEFAKSTGKAETLAGLRQKIHDDLLASEEARVKRQARKKLVDKLVEQHSIEVPHSLVEKQLEYSVQKFKSEMAMYGMPQPDDPAADAKLRERLGETAANEVKAAFIIDAIANAEKFEVGDDEVDAEIKKIAEQQNRQFEEVSAYYQKNNLVGALHERLIEDKVVDFLYDSAKITWEEEEEKEKAEEKATDEKDAEAEQDQASLPDDEKAEE